MNFVQITSTPFLPLIWTTCTTFFNANVPKKLGRGLPSLPIPILAQYTVCEKWTKYLGRALPLKSKRTVTFFGETFPNIQAIYPGRNIQETISRRQYPRDGIQVIIFSHNFQVTISRGGNLFATISRHNIQATSQKYPKDPGGFSSSRTTRPRAA